MIHHVVDRVEKSLAAAIQGVEHAGLERVQGGIFYELQRAQNAV